MIGLIKGKVVHLSAPTACLLTSSGTGYDIELPVPTFCQLQFGVETQIWTHMHVREDAQILYGFSIPKDRDVFRQLIKVNGVGAKMALAMMSNLSITELKRCVENDDEASLIRIPGVGKKTAQRLLIELKDKLKNIEIDRGDLLSGLSSGEVTSAQNITIISAEAKAALVSLGYKEKEADQAIKLAQSTTDIKFDDTQSLLKQSLKQLSK